MKIKEEKWNYKSKQINKTAKKAVDIYLKLYIMTNAIERIEALNTRINNEIIF